MVGRFPPPPTIWRPDRFCGKAISGRRSPWETSCSPPRRVVGVGVVVFFCFLFLVQRWSCFPLSHECFFLAGCWLLLSALFFVTWVRTGWWWRMVAYVSHGDIIHGHFTRTPSKWYAAITKAWHEANYWRCPSLHQRGISHKNNVFEAGWVPVKHTVFLKRIQILVPIASSWRVIRRWSHPPSPLFSRPPSNVVCSLLCVVFCRRAWSCRVWFVCCPRCITRLKLYIVCIVLRNTWCDTVSIQNS